MNKPGGMLTLKVMTFFVLLFTCFNSFGQQPSHFKIGIDDFASSHIYSLLIHSENRLYATTNYGLFVYENGHFRSITPSQEQHGSALFTLVENSKGEVFCCNLAGQIFKLENDHLELYATIPESYRGEYHSFTFNAQDVLIVSSKPYLSYSGIAIIKRTVS